MGFILMIVLLGVPFHFIWNSLAPIYFSQLPLLYQHLPFWHCIGLFAIVAILRTLIFPVPHHHTHHRFGRWKHKHY